MSKALHTIEEVISELGGAQAVAELTSRRSASAVPMWKVRQRFPAQTYAVMKAALQQRGLCAPDALWGMS